MTDSPAFILFTAFMVFVNSLASSPNWRFFSASSWSSCFILYNCFLCTSSNATPSSLRCRGHATQSAQDVKSAKLFMAAKSYAVLLTVPSIFLGLGHCCTLSWWFWRAIGEDSKVLPSAGPASSELGIACECKNNAGRALLPHPSIYPVPTTATLDVYRRKECTHSGHSGNLHKFFIHFICSVIAQALIV